MSSWLSNEQVGNARRDQSYGRTWALVFAALMLVMATVPASADEKVTFYADGVPDHLWPHLQHYFPQGAMEDYLNIIRQGCGSPSATLQDARNKARRATFAAEIDLNGDGENELIVEFRDVFLGRCGTAGCAVKFLAKLGGKWTEFGNFYELGFHRYRNRLFVSDKTSHGFRSVYNPLYAAEWNGTRYIHKKTDECRTCDPPWALK